MTRLSGLAKELELHHGVGSRGEEGESGLVGVGMTTLRNDGLTVGGTV